MGKNWEDHSREELILYFNVIHWKFKEKIHALARIFDGVYYVIPQYITEDHFEQQIKPGDGEALQTIEEIWGSKYGNEKIPIIELELMSEETCRIKEIGFDQYKALMVWAERLKKGDLNSKI